MQKYYEDLVEKYAGQKQADYYKVMADYYKDLNKKKESNPAPNAVENKLASSPPITQNSSTAVADGDLLSKNLQSMTNQSSSVDRYVEAASLDLANLTTSEYKAPPSVPSEIVTAEKASNPISPGTNYVSNQTSQASSAAQQASSNDTMSRSITENQTISDSPTKSSDDLIVYEKKNEKISFSPNADEEMRLAYLRLQEQERKRLELEKSKQVSPASSPSVESNPPPYGVGNSGLINASFVSSSALNPATAVVEKQSATMVNSTQGSTFTYGTNPNQAQGYGEVANQTITGNKTSNAQSKSNIQGGQLRTFNSKEDYAEYLRTFYNSQGQNGEEYLENYLKESESDAYQPLDKEAYVTTTKEASSLAEENELLSNPYMPRENLQYINSKIDTNGDLEDNGDGDFLSISRAVL